MSATDVKIFSNDIAMDVKYDFCQLLGIGKTIDEINEYILEQYAKEPIAEFFTIPAQPLKKESVWKRLFRGNL